MPSKTKQDIDLRHILLRISRVHFFYAAIYALAIIIFDSWNLITHESVSQRWFLVASLLIINTTIWYACRLKLNNPNFYKMLLLALLVFDILFASINVYLQRGMASKSVMLFAVPIVSAGLARSRSLLLSVASLSIAGYSYAAIKYFNDNYGQGYKVELYGELIFYSCLFFILAYLMFISFRPAKD
jgi:hypothetical protein